MKKKEKQKRIIKKRKKSSMDTKNSVLKDVVKKHSISSPTIIIVRHGETDFNSKAQGERIRGWKDVPLNARGKKQAATTGKKLSKYPVSKVIASDLGRTMNTAEAVAKYHPHIVVEPTKKLRPWDLGNLTGESVSDAVPIMIKHIKNDKDLIPGSSETFAQFLKRITGEFKRMAEEAKASPEKGAVVLVTHSRDTRVAEGWILAGGKDNVHIDKKPLLDKEDVTSPGGYMVLKWDKDHWIRTI